MSINASFDSARNSLFGTGLSFPILPDGQGRLLRVSGIDSIKQAIRFWINVRIGEVLYMRDKGIGARDYVHLLHRDVESRAKSEIPVRLMQWESRIESARVTVSKDVEGRSVTIVVWFKPIGYAIEESVTVPIITAESS